MSVRIAVNCDACLIRLSLPPGSVSLTIDPDPGFCQYRFRCTACGTWCTRHAPPVVISQLRDARVVTVMSRRWPDLTGHPLHDPVLTEDDLIGFGLALEATVDTVAELVTRR